MSLLRSIIRPSRALVIASTVAGAASGIAGVALIALVQEAIGRGSTGARSLAVGFAGLCLVAALTRIVAHAATIRLAQGAVNRLVVEICRKVMALPLRRFEAIDHSGLLAVLTEDIGIVAGTLAGLPLLAMNVAIVVVCLGYLGLLAPIVLLFALVFALVALVGHRLASGRGLRSLRAARVEQDRLIADFRTLIAGFRNLKQHHGRRQAFFGQSLEVASASVRDRTVSGLTSFALAATWVNSPTSASLAWSFSSSPRSSPSMGGPWRDRSW